MDIRNQVESLFNVKRQKKLNEASENYRKILQAHPDLQAIEDEMIEASQEVILTGVYDEDKMEAITAKKDKLLKDLGLEGADKAKFDCDLCEDRGYVNGKVCQCLKKELINAYFNLGENGGIIKDSLTTRPRTDLRPGPIWKRFMSSQKSTLPILKTKRTLSFSTGQAGLAKPI